MRTIAFALAAAFYPFFVYLGMERLPPRFLALVLLALCLLRWYYGKTAHSDLQGLLLIAAVFLLVTSVLNDSTWLLAYPVVVSGIFLGLFGYSLLHPPTIVERIARLHEPDLPPRGVAYTRDVTRVWCVFFLANGAISAATVWLGDLALWTLYNGLISYVLMGLLFAGETLVRNRVRKGF
jgi:uncharacterized membrane protein